MDEWMGGWVDGWMGGWMDGWVGGWGIEGDNEERWKELKEETIESR